MGITLLRENEETLTVLVNDFVAGTVTHDSVGWDGIEAVDRIVSKIGMLLSITVTKEEGVF